jgi:hypothetical protein
MRQVNKAYAGQGNFGSNYTMCIGIVKDNADPAQHGRLKVFIPSIDTKDFLVEDLPWATYCSPFGGTTADFVVGRNGSKIPGASTYGFWAIPKNGAQVLVGFMEGEPNIRFWMGCFFQPELNRTLPQSIDPIKTEIDESGMWPQAEIPHYAENLGEAGLGPGTKHYKTRGGFERSVSHPSNKNRNKPMNDGYFKKPLEPEKSDSQVVSLTSPGRHYISFQDVDEFCRTRWKTTEGTQIIMDDTNERIYISTARGRNWIEIDEGSGKIYFYTAAKFNVHSENDINLYSSENINIVAKKRINIQSEERAVKIQAHRNIELLSTDANIKISASRDLYLKTFAGPRASFIPYKEFCTKPPYSGQPLGLRRDYEEEAGSVTSKIFIETVDGSDFRINSGPLIVSAKDRIDIKSISDKLDLQAANSINLKTSAKINLQTGVINLNSGSILGRTYYGTFVGNHPDGGTPPPGGANSADTAASAKKVPFMQIKPKMIVPEHESWTRDEDEPKCATPRNPKYQG